MCFFPSIVIFSISTWVVDIITAEFPSPSSPSLRSSYVRFLSFRVPFITLYFSYRWLIMSYFVPDHAKHGGGERRHSLGGAVDRRYPLRFPGTGEAKGGKSLFDYYYLHTL